MKEKESISRLPTGVRYEEMKEELRDRVRTKLPYFAGVITAMTVAGVSFGAIHRFNSNEDLIANAVIFAATIGAKVFKDVQRDSKKVNTFERIQSRKLSKAQQMRIAISGTFEEKSALLDNRHLNRKAKDVIQADEIFRATLIRNLEIATIDATSYESALYSTRNPYYLDVLEAIRKSIGLYQRNLVVLDMRSKDFFDYPRMLDPKLEEQTDGPNADAEIIPLLKGPGLAAAI